MAAIYLLEVLNKPTSELNFEIDLGFNKHDFISNYVKRFYSVSYNKITVSLFLNVNELKIFDTFYTDTLKGGIYNFKADFGIGEQEYIIHKTPEIQLIEADYYKVDLFLLYQSPIMDVICLKTNNCLNNLIKCLNGKNIGLSANVEASIDKLNAALCIYNLSHNVYDDINMFYTRKILTSSMIQEDF